MSNTFTIKDMNNKVLGRHSCRNEEEARKVIQAARLAHGDLIAVEYEEPLPVPSPWSRRRTAPSTPTRSKAARKKSEQSDSDHAFDNGLVVARTDSGTPLLVAITGIEGEGKVAHWKGVVVAEGGETWDELRRRTGQPRHHPCRQPRDRGRTPPRQGRRQPRRSGILDRLEALYQVIGHQGGCVTTVGNGMGECDCIRSEMAEFLTGHGRSV